MHDHRVANLASYPHKRPPLHPPLHPLGVQHCTPLAHFRGDDHASFDEVVRIYLDQQGNPAIEAVCIDVAGPVSGGMARLTNRDDVPNIQYSLRRERPEKSA